MKHIVRKPLLTSEISEQTKQALDKAVPDENYIKTIQAEGVENWLAVAQTESGHLVHMFGYQDRNATYFIPEPHPVVLYFHGAQTYLKHWHENKAKLLETLKSSPPHCGKQLDAFYNFYAVAAGYAAFLYNALEAFMNHIIPPGHVHTKRGRDGTVHQTKDDIQRYATFEEKIKDVIPGAVGKSFHVKHGSKFDTLKSLKIFRDEVTHTKAYGAIGTNPYRKLFVMALDFNQEAAIYAVREYINFYEPNLIEDCGCENDH